MKYEIAQRLKVGEYELPHAPIIIKRYGWVVTARDLTWEEARAHRKALKGARIYPMKEGQT